MPTAHQGKGAAGREDMSRNEQARYSNIKPSSQTSLKAMPIQNQRTPADRSACKPTAHQPLSRQRQASPWLQEQTGPRPTDRARKKKQARAAQTTYPHKHCSDLQHEVPGQLARLQNQMSRPRPNTTAGSKVVKLHRQVQRTTASPCCSPSPPEGVKTIRLKLPTKRRGGPQHDRQQHTNHTCSWPHTHHTSARNLTHTTH